MTAAGRRNSATGCARFEIDEIIVGEFFCLELVAAAGSQGHAGPNIESSGLVEDFRHSGVPAGGEVQSGGAAGELVFR